MELKKCMTTLKDWSFYPLYKTIKCHNYNPNPNPNINYKKYYSIHIRSSEYWIYIKDYDIFSIYPENDARIEIQNEINNIIAKYSKVYFCNKFNHSIANISHLTTHLDFGFHFNTYINNFPPNLIYLYFNGIYRYPLNNLPPTVKYLWVSCIVPLANLPQLILLCLGNGFICNNAQDEILDILPESLKYLRITDSKSLMLNLPIGLKVLLCNNKYEHIERLTIQYSTLKIVNI